MKEYGIQNVKKNMYDANLYKYLQNEYLKKLLFQTENKKLVEMKSI